MLPKAFFLLVLLWPIQTTTPTQARPNSQCHLDNDHQRSGLSSQSEPAPDDANLFGQKLARIPPKPTRFRIMPSRYVELREALAGYCETGVPLVATDGPRYYPAGFSDDLGIYYFIPRLALLTHLELRNATDLFFGAPLIASLVIAIAFLMLQLRSGWLKVWAVALLLVFTLRSLHGGDVYSVQTVAALSIIPCFLYLAGKSNVGKTAIVFMAGAGIVIGLAHLIRSHAATGVAIFLVVAVIFHREWSHKRKLALLAGLIGGFLVPAIYFQSLLARRNAFLAVAQPDSIHVLDRHPFWHSVYIGFSFVPNQYVPGYRDDLVAEKVRSIDPSARYLSAEYERVVRGEVLRLIREHPLFTLATIVAKLAAIGYRLLIWANVGLLASVLYPKPWPLEAGFWAALAFDSSFGLVVIPHQQYLQGFMVVAALYGIVSIGYALEQYGERRIQ
jgi:hypothetical protein